MLYVYVKHDYFHSVQLDKWWVKFLRWSHLLSKQLNENTDDAVLAMRWYWYWESDYEIRLAVRQTIREGREWWELFGHTELSSSSLCHVDNTDNRSRPGIVAKLIGAK